jgi:hypothetical protein
LVEANVSEKLAVFIFRAEVSSSALKMETARFPETLACTNPHGDQTQKNIITKEWFMSSYGI